MKQRAALVVLTLSMAALMLGGCASTPQFTPEQQAVLQLDYQSFDQTMGGGWRAWAAEGEHAEAARMLDEYARLHTDLSGGERRIIRFHAGQMYAWMERRGAAIARFRESFNPEEPEDAAFRWNAYVRGTIAFLEGELETLHQCCDELLEQGEVEMTMPDGNVIRRVPNLDVLERFIEHFGRTYREAYSGQIDDGEDDSHHDGH